jgi:hypothetical protein
VVLSRSAAAGALTPSAPDGARRETWFPYPMLRIAESYASTYDLD